MIQNNDNGRQVAIWSMVQGIIDVLSASTVTL